MLKLRTWEWRKLNNYKLSAR